MDLTELTEKEQAEFLIRGEMSARERADLWNRFYGPEIAIVVYGNGQPFLAMTMGSASTTRSLSLGSGQDLPVVRISDPPPNFGPYVDLRHVRPVKPRDDRDFAWERAGGGVICESCSKDYRSHPLDLAHVDYDHRPFLHRLCDGRLVKL